MPVMNLARIFEKLHTHYDAICLFQVSTDSIFQLKYPITGNETLAASQHLSWSKALLCLVAESLRSVVNRDVHAFRYGGDEFLVVAPNCTQEHMDTLVIMCLNRMRTLSQKQGIAVSVAVGKAWSDAQRDINVFNLIRSADREMYLNKQAMKYGV